MAEQPTEDQTECSAASVHTLDINLPPADPDDILYTMLKEILRASPL